MFISSGGSVYGTKRIGGSPGCGVPDSMGLAWLRLDSVRLVWLGLDCASDKHTEAAFGEFGGTESRNWCFSILH